MHKIFGGRGTGAKSFRFLTGGRVLAETFPMIRSALDRACSPAAIKDKASAKPSSASGKTPSSFTIPAAEPPFLAKLMRRNEHLCLVLGTWYLVFGIQFLVFRIFF